MPRKSENVLKVDKMKPKKKSVDVPIVKERKPRKHHPGTRALMNIRKSQKNVELLIPKRNIQRLIREITSEYYADMRFQKSAMLAIQTAAEAYMIDIYREANLAAINSKRVTVMPRDIILVKKLDETFQRRS